MNVSYQPGEWLAVVSDHAIIVVPGDTNADLTTALWQLMEQPVELATVIDVLSNHSASSLTNLPNFTVLVRQGADVRVAVRGDVDLALSAAEGHVTVSGAGVTTWSERFVHEVRSVSLRHAESDGAWLPVVCGAARVGALEIDFERDPFSVVVAVDVDAEEEAPEGDDVSPVADAAIVADADFSVDADASDVMPAEDLAVEPDAEVEAEVETEAELEPDAAQGDELHAETEREAEAEPESEDEPATEPEAELETQPEVDEAAEAVQSDELDAEPEFEAEAEAAAEADFEASPEPEPEPEPDLSAEPLPESAAFTESDVDASTITGFEDEPGSDFSAQSDEVHDADAQHDASESVVVGDTLLPHHTIAEQAGVAEDPAAAEPAAEEEIDSMWADTVYRAPARPPLPEVPVAPAIPVADDDGIHDGATISLAQAQALRADVGVPAVAGVPQLLPRTGSVATVEAPGSARVRISTGQTLTLDRPIIIGRRPRSTRVNEATMPQLVAVESPQQDISRNHLEIRLEGDSVVVTDLHTTNGTMLLRHGQDPVRLHPGETTIVVSGDSVDLGDGVAAIFEDLP